MHLQAYILPLLALITLTAAAPIGSTLSAISGMRAQFQANSYHEQQTTDDQLNDSTIRTREKWRSEVLRPAPSSPFMWATSTEAEDTEERGDSGEGNIRKGLMELDRRQSGGIGFLTM